MWVGERGATPRRRNVNRLWKQATKKAGVEPEAGLHLHDLRHTGNQLAEGRLRGSDGGGGPLDVRAALIYQHAGRDRERQIPDRLSAVIHAGREGTGTSRARPAVRASREGPFALVETMGLEPTTPACKALPASPCEYVRGGRGAGEKG